MPHLMRVRGYAQKTTQTHSATHTLAQTGISSQALPHADAGAPPYQNRRTAHCCVVVVVVIAETHI